jgi:hypothetical protein
LPERPTVHKAVLPAGTPERATDFLGLGALADAAGAADAVIDISLTGVEKLREIIYRPTDLAWPRIHLAAYAKRFGQDVLLRGTAARAALFA